MTRTDKTLGSGVIMILILAGLYETLNRGLISVSPKTGIVLMFVAAGGFIGCAIFVGIVWLRRFEVRDWYRYWKNRRQIERNQNDIAKRGHLL